MVDERRAGNRASVGRLGAGTPTRREGGRRVQTGSARTLPSASAELSGDTRADGGNARARVRRTASGEDGGWGHGSEDNGCTVDPPTCPHTRSLARPPARASPPSCTLPPLAHLFARPPVHGPVDPRYPHVTRTREAGTVPGRVRVRVSPQTPGGLPVQCT
ncbi:uncharacterized protein B0H18DRAFT_971999, partial [Fomitopsis serialis]|uniref:uncharacterized protein n=1 Tax=Fomitopsis serialis TaxID=139415 RepID=UPI002008D99F